MGFHVDEDALDAAAAKMKRLEATVDAAKAYNSQHVDLRGLGDSGIFVTAIGVLDEVRGAVEDELNHLSKLMTASAWELRDTARVYRQTDDEADARLDKTYDAAVPPRGAR